MRCVFMFLVVFFRQAAVTMLSEKQLQIIKKNMVMMQQKLCEKKNYVDDLLKSVNTSQFALKLVDDARQMSKAEGFHLTKFIRNDKKSACNDSKIKA